VEYPVHYAFEKLEEPEKETAGFGNYAEKTHVGK
jgi:hypothetical protein